MMKKIFYLLIIFLIVCCQNEKIEIKYYPSHFDISDFDGEIILLDSINYNFSQITDKIDFQNLILEFNDNKKTKRIIPHNFNIGSFKRRNILIIDSDSIYVENGFSINELDLILKKHYLNNRKNKQYSESPKKAIIGVMLDSTENSRTLKPLMIKLTNSFDKLKNESIDTLELWIFFNYLKIDKPKLIRKVIND